MSRDLAAPSGPLVSIGRASLATLGYLGGLGILAASVPRGIVRPRGEAPPFGKAVVRQLDWLFGMGLPLVGLSHVGLGSFLSMQAFYGATFLEGVGPVVIIGLLRNLAPIVTGFILCGMFSARLVPELRGPRRGLDDDPRIVPDRDVTLGQRPDPRPEPEPARLAASRILAAMAVAPVLMLWGTIVGVVIGGLVARSVMGIPWPIYLSKGAEMLWLRDAFGLVIKGVLFGCVTAAIACHEGLRPGLHGPRDLPTACFRSAALGLASILLLNTTCFILLYFAGPAFGPTVLTPPTH